MDELHHYDGKNFLYCNDGNAIFTPILAGDIATDLGDSRGAVWGDYDNDGLPDLYVANMQAANFLYHNNGDGTFSRITEGEAATDEYNCPGADWADIDNDGDIDLFVANGLSILRPGQQTIEESVLLANDGNANHWININCVGLASPVPVLGTKVRAKAVIGGVPVWQLREITSQTGMFSQNSQRVHFGLADAEVIDSLKVEWPSGNIDVYTQVAANTFYKAVQGAGLNPIVSGVDASGPALPAGFELDQNFPNPFNPSTTITYRLESPGRVSLIIYDLHGRQVATLLTSEFEAAGAHEIAWGGRDSQDSQVASGVYFCRLRVHPAAGGHQFAQTRKMVVMR